MDGNFISPHTQTVWNQLVHRRRFRRGGLPMPAQWITRGVSRLNLWKAVLTLTAGAPRCWCGPSGAMLGHGP